MNFDNIRINSAYASMYAPKKSVSLNESVQGLRRVKAIEADGIDGKYWKLVDADSGKTINTYGFIENLKRDVADYGYMLMNDVDEADADEEPVTKVFFVKSSEPDGDEEVVAIFPEEQWSVFDKDEVASYVHRGQHGAASLKWAKEQQPASEEEYRELYDELVNQVGYRLDVIDKPVTEAEDGSEVENSGNTEIFTLYIADIEDEERPIDDMKYAITYTDFDEACEDAMKCAKEYASDEHVINVSVMAGEYQTDGGDVYGEPEAVYTVSNKDEEATAIAREKANYVSKYVDGYATDGEERIPELAKIKDDELKSKSTKDAEITAG